MKNWKTTIAGLLTGLPFMVDALVEAYNAGYFTDKTGWQLFASIAWIVVTRLVKDHDATGGQRIIGDRPKDR